MIQSLSKRERRTVAVALLLVAISTLYLLTVSPYLHSWQKYAGEAQGLAKQVIQHKQTIATADAIEKDLQAIEHRRKNLGLYLEAQTPALAAAVLQQNVKDAVAKVNGRLISTQIVSGGTTRNDDRPFVSLRVRMRADLETMRSVLYSLESQHTFLFLDNIYIRNNAANGMVIPRMGDSDALDVGFDVGAYLAGEAQ